MYMDDMKKQLAMESRMRELMQPYHANIPRTDLIGDKKTSWSKGEKRVESDTMGEVSVPAEMFWWAQT